MKVAALVERRDRIMKNRRIAKCRKKSTTTPPTCNEVASASASSPLSSAAASVIEVEVPKSTETHELKIKTVFQRHKQEHHEQEEAAAIRTVRKTIVLSLFSSRPQMSCVWVTARCWQCMQCTVMFDTHNRISLRIEYVQLHMCMKVYAYVSAQELNETRRLCNEMCLYFFSSQFQCANLRSTTTVKVQVNSLRLLLRTRISTTIQLLLLIIVYNCRMWVM